MSVYFAQTRARANYIQHLYDIFYTLVVRRSRPRPEALHKYGIFVAVGFAEPVIVNRYGLKLAVLRTALI